MEKYEKVEKVGEGTFGKVYKAIEKTTGRLVALKKCRLAMDTEGIPRTMLRDISLLQWVSTSIYVVRLLGVEHVQTKSQPPKSNLYLVFEYIDTDLKKLIVLNGKPLEPFLVQKLMFQLCKGLLHCHSHGVIHRDLKPANLLLVKGLLKIADLGLGLFSTVPFKAYTRKIATLWYRAPEVLLGSSRYSTAPDMWSVGCIFAEMVTRQALFPGDSEFQQLNLIFRCLGTPTEQQWPGVTTLPNWPEFSTLRNWHVYQNCEPQDLTILVPSLSPQGVDLLTQMLKCNPAERIAARTALDHPYFDSLDKSQF